MDESGTTRSATPSGRGLSRSPIAAVRVLCVALLCALAPAATNAATGTPSSPDAIAARAPAPAFELPAPDGTTLRLGDLRGEVVYLDFWASWCPPCLRSFPWMDALAERHAATGLRVVAINLDSDRDAAMRFLAATGADFDIVFDPDGESAEAYGLRGMPSSYVIDREGRVAFAHVGFRSADAAKMEAVISGVLAEKTPVLAAAKEGGR